MKNIKYIIKVTLIVFFGISQSFSINMPSISDSLTKLNDGPYINVDKGGLNVKWIESGVVHNEIIHGSDFGLLNTKFQIEFNKDNLNLQSSEENEYSFNNVNKIIALSDIHGQYGILVKLLQENNVIDNNRDWIFEDGHLVIVGDIFDRGDEVTEALWLVYNLEQQAKRIGGRVHYLIGNHELMIFDNDLRYINKKYEESASLLGTSYNLLFSNETFLGNWLRSKPVIITINDILFCHGGISSEFVERDFTIEKANRLFKENIFHMDKIEYKKDSTFNFLTGSSGPLWYRGYFRDEGFSEKHLENIRSFLQINTIVVGHTSFKSINPIYEGSIIGVDSSIKNGQGGEVLIYENKEFFRGNITGEKSRISIE